MNEPHIDFDLNYFTQLKQKGARVILTWTDDESRSYRIVFCADENKYVQEVIQVNAMNEKVWVFSTAWHGDNHNNSTNGYRLCEIIRFLCDQMGNVGEKGELSCGN